jgi:hypothetical protein
MAWKAAATVASVTDIANIGSTKPITNKDAQAQFAAALEAAQELAIGAGPWTVELSGNGYAYPTSKVTVTISEPSEEEPGMSWEAKAALNSPQDLAKLIPVPAVGGDASAVAQFAAAVQAANTIMVSKTVGNIRPTEVHAEGDTSSPTATLTVTVRRPTAEGYQN